MAELLPLALAAAFWPLLLAVVLVALRARHPAKLLVCFLAGGLLTTISVGLLIVYALNGSSLVTSDQSTTDPVVDIALGALALIVAYAMKRREKPPPAPDSPKKESKTNKRIEDMLERGAPWAFAAGVVLDILPSPFALSALKSIAEADYSLTETVVVLLCFYLIVFAFIELPLIGYLVATERAVGWTVRFNAWLTRSWYRVAIYALLFAGIYLIAKGIFGAVG
jgi:Sap, sulfolipid-1-addressing protein